MKVLVLGAAGKAGRAAVRSLLGLRGIERVFLADRNAEGLNKLAADLGGFPVSPRFLDAESERSLRQRMVEADVVLGCLGPFYRHEARVVEAAVAARRDYISLCDDPDATEAAFSLAGEAEKGGVRVLSGCGLTPGLSNLMACRAAACLKGAESLEVAWYVEIGQGLGTATIEHLMHSLREKASCLEGGRERSIRGGSWEEYVEFPPPVGWRVAGFMAHPEPVTLPRKVKGILDVWFKAATGDRRKSFALQTLAWLGGAGIEEPWAGAFQALAAEAARRGGGGSLTALKVTARAPGRVTGGSEILATVGDYYGISGRVLAAALGRWAGGSWPLGVHAPEALLDDRLFFAGLREMGVRFLVGEERSAGVGEVSGAAS